MGSLGAKMDLYGSTNNHAAAVPSGAIVRVRGREKHLGISELGLTLSSCKTSCSDITELSVQWRDVIGCETDEETLRSDTRSSLSPAQSGTTTLIIHYVQHKVKDKTLRPAKVKVRASPSHVVGWARKIREYCAKVPGRPRKVLTIINPIGGKGEAPKVFTKNVSPLFSLAGIQTTAISTERQREAVELAENLDLAEYDGLVLLGGDGLYHEVLEGLTKQTQRRSGVNIHDPEAHFTPINIPIGVIPTGTGNAVSRWANGITDIYTSTLNVIRGQQQRAQISSVHSNGVFLRMSGVTIAYGMMSDMIRRTDELRWMKTKRYPYAMLGMILGRKRMFNCCVQYRTSNSDNHNLQNNGGNRDLELSPTASVNPGGPWQTYDSQGRQIRCTLSFSCEKNNSSDDHAVQTITGTSSDLIIDHGCFSVKLLKYLLNYISPVKSLNTSSKICVIEAVTAYRITLVENNEVSSGSCCRSSSKDRELERLSAIDGESIPLSSPTLDVRIRGSFVPLYGHLDHSNGSADRGGCKNKAFENVNDD